MEGVNYIGGARIGLFNATWPFARLKLNNGVLNLSVLIFKNLSFSKENIISLKRYDGVLSKGIKIIHNVPNYKENIIFWTFSDCENIIKEIEEYFSHVPIG